MDAAGAAAAQLPRAYVQKRRSKTTLKSYVQKLRSKTTFKNYVQKFSQFLFKNAFNCCSKTCSHIHSTIVQKFSKQFREQLLPTKLSFEHGAKECIG